MLILVEMESKRSSICKTMPFTTYSVDSSQQRQIKAKLAKLNSYESGNRLEKWAFDEVLNTQDGAVISCIDEADLEQVQSNFDVSVLEYIDEHVESQDDCQQVTAVSKPDSEESSYSTSTPDGESSAAKGRDF